jgi:hypothetical protein
MARGLLPGADDWLPSGERRVNYKRRWRDVYQIKFTFSKNKLKTIIIS